MAGGLESLPRDWVEDQGDEANAGVDADAFGQAMEHRLDIRLQDLEDSLCFAAGNAKALAENVLRLAALPPLERQQMGQSGRRYFDRYFAPDVLADELVEHFNEMISGREKTK